MVERAEVKFKGVHLRPFRANVGVETSSSRDL